MLCEQLDPFSVMSSLDTHTTSVQPLETCHPSTVTPCCSFHPNHLPQHQYKYIQCVYICCLRCVNVYQKDIILWMDLFRVQGTYDTHYVPMCTLINTGSVEAPTHKPSNSLVAAFNIDTNQKVPFLATHTL